MVVCYGLHDVFEQRSWPGEVPEVAERLPDETIAEEFLPVVYELIVGWHRHIVILVASVDRTYHADQVLHLSGCHPLGLFLLYLWVENAREEVVLVGRQMARVLVNARIVAAESQDLAVLTLVFIDYLGHLEHTGGESAVQQRHNIPVGTYSQNANNTHYYICLYGGLGLADISDEQREEGEERQEIVELHRQGGKREHQHTVCAEDEPLSRHAGRRRESSARPIC